MEKIFLLKSYFSTNSHEKLITKNIFVDQYAEINIFDFFNGIKLT